MLQCVESLYSNFQLTAVTVYDAQEEQCCLYKLKPVRVIIFQLKCNFCCLLHVISVSETTDTAITMYSQILPTLSAETQ